VRDLSVPKKGRQRRSLVLSSSTLVSQRPYYSPAETIGCMRN
jgi:hypothetical protein